MAIQHPEYIWGPEDHKLRRYGHWWDLDNVTGFFRSFGHHVSGMCQGEMLEIWNVATCWGTCCKDANREILVLENLEIKSSLFLFCLWQNRLKNDLEISG